MNNMRSRLFCDLLSCHDFVIYSFDSSFCYFCPSLPYFSYDNAIALVFNNTQVFSNSVRAWECEFAPKVYLHGFILAMQVTCWYKVQLLFDLKLPVKIFSDWTAMFQ
jgi:hypothetical protein